MITYRLHPRTDVKKMEIRSGDRIIMRVPIALAHHLIERLRYAAASLERQDYTLTSPFVASIDDVLTADELTEARAWYEQEQREYAAQLGELRGLDESFEDAISRLRSLPQEMAAHEAALREVA